MDDLPKKANLVKLEQGFVDGENIIYTMLEEIFDDDVEFTALGKGKADRGK